MTKNVPSVTLMISSGENPVMTSLLVASCSEQQQTPSNMAPFMALGPVMSYLVLSYFVQEDGI